MAKGKGRKEAERRKVEASSRAKRKGSRKGKQSRNEAKTKSRDLKPRCK